ncbi:hypothetical protein D3C80_1282440 [compost metagenome]
MSASTRLPIPTSSEPISLPTKMLCFSICLDCAPSSANRELAVSRAAVMIVNASSAFSSVSSKGGPAGRAVTTGGPAAAARAGRTKPRPLADISWRFIEMVSVAPTLARKSSGTMLAPFRMFSPSNVAFLAKEDNDFSRD